jgi:hypothetical protein
VEAQQINAMNAELKRVIKETQSFNGINLDIGNKILNGVGAVINVKGTPKADVYIAEMKEGKIIKNSVLGYLSLKNANNPQRMQQWGGITGYSNHEDAINFANNVKKYLQDTYGNSNIMVKGDELRSAKPTSKDLAMKVVYGEGSGVESVDAVYVCASENVKLEEVKPGTYKFVGGDWFVKEEVPSGGYEPYFYALHRKDRSNMGIKQCRMGIYPKNWRMKNIKLV